MRHTTIATDFFTRDRLCHLARSEGKTIAAKLYELVESECLAAGIDTTNAAVRVQAWGESFAVDLWDTYRVSLSRVGIVNLARDLSAIATAGGLAVNLDDHFTISRRGGGVVLEIEALVREGEMLGRKKIDLRKVMTPDEARRIARGLLAGLPAEAAA